MAGRGRCQLASSGWRWVFGQSSRKRKAFAQPISDMPRSDMPRSDMARSSAALCARRFEVLSAPKGVGNAGCPWHPQPPVQQESTGVEAAGPPESPGIPARNGFNGFLRALLGDHAWLPPSSADRSAHLTPASERQDHTTSPSASAPFVRVPVITHEPKPALRSLCTPDTAASTASRPASVTIASRPSMGRDSDRIRVILVNRETIYFCCDGWTGFCRSEVICPSRLGKNSNYGTGVARSVTTSSHSAMLAWNVCKTSRNARRAEARPHLQATHAFSAMYATNRSKPRMLSTRVKL